MWMPSGARTVSVVLLLLATVADAATVVVDSATTTYDSNPGDGICDASGNGCGVNAAVQETNALPGPDVIAIPAGVYHGVAVTITDAITIVGQGVGTTVLDPGDGSWVFTVADGATATVAGITFVDAPFWALSVGAGDLTVRDCELVNNGTSANGGSIYVAGGTVVVERSIFANDDPSGGMGIFVLEAGTLTVTDSVFKGHVVSSGGSAIHYQQGSTVSVVNSTLSDNVGDAAIVGSGSPGNVLTMLNTTVVGSGAGLRLNGTPGTLTNVIVSAGTGAACESATMVSSRGGNLSTDDTCNFHDATDLENTDPLVDPLADNGGPTQTHGLQASSPARDTAVLASCPETDQRGAPRPSGTGCDRGAFEAGAVVPTTTSTTFPTTSTSTSSSTSSTSTSSSTSSSTTSSSSSTTTSTTVPVSTTSSSTSTTLVGSTTTTSAPASTTTTTSSTSTTVVVTTTTTSTSVPGSSTSTSTTLPGSTTTTSAPVSTTTTTSSTSTTVVVTTTTTTLPPALLDGRKLLLSGKPGSEGRQKLLMIATGAVDVGGGPGSADDPTQPGVEASLRLYTSAGGFDRSWDLGDPGVWKPLKRKKPDKGYKYRKGDPITLVIVKTGRLVKVVGKGAGLGDALATNPDPVAVELIVGGTRFCAQFGGGRYVEGRKYLAKRTGVAGECPAASSDGAFVN